MENNEIISALGQVPELVKATKTLLEAQEKTNAVLAEGQKERVLAEIPESAIDKVADAAADRVSRTKCATPDTIEISRNVAKEIANIVYSSVVDAAKTAIENTPMKQEVQHTFGIEMIQYANKEARRLAYSALALAIIFGVGSVITIATITNGKEHLGKEYAEVYFSKYTTESERQALGESCYTISFLPKELSSNKALLKQRIKQNKMILKQREQESRANKGKFSTETPLVR